MSDIKMQMFCDNKYWQNAINKGVDKDMNKSLLSMICNPEGRQLIVDAICDNRYIIQPPKIMEVPKPNGKIREVYVNQPMDRIVLSVINQIYNELYNGMIHPNCLSYQTGIGVPRIIKSLTDKLSEGLGGYKADLSKYFDSVNKETLFSTLDKISTNSQIDKIVRDYYSDDRVFIKGEEVERYKSIAQGCAIGTFMANIVLNDIDTELSKLDIVYYRYSDDLIMLGKDADKAINILENMLIPKGLTLNPKKVQKIENGTPFTFLGVKIVDAKHVTIGEESLHTFKNEIKSRTINKVGVLDKNGNRVKSMNKTQIKRVIKDINWYLYTSFYKSKNNFGWSQYFFSICNMPEDIAKMDTFVKDCIRACYTGKKRVGGIGSVDRSCTVDRGKGRNVRENLNKTKGDEFNGKDLLIECGYYSMSHMYKTFCTNKNVFNTEIMKIVNGISVEM